jgi:hypothetical protein
MELISIQQENLMSLSRKLAQRPHLRTAGHHVDSALLRGVIAALALVPAASFADTRAGGELTTANIVINNAVDEGTDIWEVLESESIDLDFQSNLIVTACSDVDNPGGGIANTYRFVLSIDDTSPGLNTSSERTIDDLYDDPAKDDPDQVSVCSTKYYQNVSAGVHTIQWLGSKATGGMADVTVLDTTMTIGAFDGSDL